MPLIDPIELLRREDKWYLGNGGMLLYAPPFPKYLRTPGFWDECHFGDLAVERLLCVSFAGEVAVDQSVGAPLVAPSSGDVWKQQPGGTSPAPTGPSTARPLRNEGGNASAFLLDLEPHLSHWRWFPDRIEARHYLVQRDGVGYKQQRGVRIFVDETRRIAPDGTLFCDLSFDVLAGCEISALHVVAWTLRQNVKEAKASRFSDLKGYGSSLTYRQPVFRRAHARGKKPVELAISMSGTRTADSIEVTPAHGAHLVTGLRYTPMWDSLKHGKLSGRINGDNQLGSLVYAGLHWRVPIEGRTAEGVGIRVNVQDAAKNDAPKETVPTGGYHQSLATPDPGESWREFMSLVPHFECSDAMLTRYYWYRWYGLRLNAVPPGGNYVAPAVTEGIAYFRGVITYSLMCHLNECKWLADPSLARGCLENHLKHQARAGHLPGHIYVSEVNKKGFYHTDLGLSVADLLRHHPDKAWAKQVYRPLVKLLGYYRKDRDREGLNLFDIRDQYETGQEFTSRYFHADERADLYGWEHKLRLKGVDVTTYVYHLARLLARLAIDADNPADVMEYAGLAEQIKAAVRALLWDPGQHFFLDYNAAKKERSTYMVSVGFWPLLSDLASDEQALAAAAHLDDPQKFATEWPTPSVPVDDKYFSADPYWRGERANCPWNGRVWPMNDSHIAGAYARLARLEPGTYRPKLATYIRRFIEMMHFETVGAESQTGPRTPVGAPLVAPSSIGAAEEQPGGTSPAPTEPGGAFVNANKDLTRPNCFEHYHPFDGTACEYRGIDDYMHSWVADLLLKYGAGVRFEDGKLVVDPMPFGFDWFVLKDCRVAGRRLDVCWNRTLDGGESRGFRVMLDGAEVFGAPEPARFEVEL